MPSRTGKRYTTLKSSTSLFGKLWLCKAEQISALLSSTGTSRTIKRGFNFALSLISRPATCIDKHLLRMSELHESPSITIVLLDERRMRLIRRPISVGLIIPRNLNFVTAEDSRLSDEASEGPMTTCESDRIGIVLPLFRTILLRGLPPSRGSAPLAILAYVRSCTEATLETDADMLARDFCEASTWSIILPISFLRQFCLKQESVYRQYITLKLRHKSR